MLSVEQELADGRVQVMRARAIPAQSAGLAVYAVGTVVRRPIRAAEPAEGDDLMAMASAVGVAVTAKDALAAVSVAEPEPLSDESRVRLRVLRTAPSTVARVAPLDDLGMVAAALNVLSRQESSQVVYTDRWAAGVLAGCDRP